MRLDKVTISKGRLLPLGSPNGWDPIRRQQSLPEGERLLSICDRDEIAGFTLIPCCNAC
jgi:hypothetical protein